MVDFSSLNRAQGMLGIDSLGTDISTQSAVLDASGAANGAVNTATKNVGNALDMNGVGGLNGVSAEAQSTAQNVVNNAATDAQGLASTAEAQSQEAISAANAQKPGEAQAALDSAQSAAADAQGRATEVVGDAKSTVSAAVNQAQAIVQSAQQAVQDVIAIGTGLVAAGEAVIQGLIGSALSVVPGLPSLIPLPTLPQVPIPSIPIGNLADLPSIKVNIEDKIPDPPTNPIKKEEEVLENELLPEEPKPEPKPSLYKREALPQDEIDLCTDERQSRAAIAEQFKSLMRSMAEKVEEVGTDKKLYRQKKLFTDNIKLAVSWAGVIGPNGSDWDIWRSSLVSFYGTKEADAINPGEDLIFYIDWASILNATYQEILFYTPCDELSEFDSALAQLSELQSLVEEFQSLLVDEWVKDKKKTVAKAMSKVYLVHRKITEIFIRFPDKVKRGGILKKFSQDRLELPKDLGTRIVKK